MRVRSGVLLGVLLLLTGCSMAALMNEQTINQRLDAMEARLRAMELQREAQR